MNGQTLMLDIPGLTEAAYDQARHTMTAFLDSGEKNRHAISQAFLELIALCPTANASDLWHHVAYRAFCEYQLANNRGNPNQSWVRSSGEALEIAISELYRQELGKHHIHITPLISGPERQRALDDMGIQAEVGGSKLDISLRLALQDGKLVIFGGVHVKASLAERVSDDVPASRAMMAKGFFSPLWTLDVKSFPPPTGDLINRGELGTPERPSDKRKYIEEHGDFDHCYSGNARTVPSVGKTNSGKAIFRIDLAQQPDLFAQEVVARANAYKP